MATGRLSGSIQWFNKDQLENNATVQLLVMRITTNVLVTAMKMKEGGGKQSSEEELSVPSRTWKGTLTLILAAYVEGHAVLFKGSNNSLTHLVTAPNPSALIQHTNHIHVTDSPSHMLDFSTSLTCLLSILLLFSIPFFKQAVQFGGEASTTISTP